MFIKASGGHFE